MAGPAVSRESAPSEKECFSPIIPFGKYKGKDFRDALDHKSGVHDHGMINWL